VDRLMDAQGMDRPAWTEAGDPLPGGDFADAERLLDTWSRQWPWLPVALAHRWLRHYGTLAGTLLGQAQGLDDLGEHFGAGLYRAEVDYLIRNEWARSADDILWRRTKLGLRTSPEQRERLDRYVRESLGRELPDAGGQARETGT